jgi:ribosome-associated protein
MMPQDVRRFGLIVTPTVSIPPGELDARATKSGGPGGQHVNTSSTRVELLWRLAESRAVTDEQRARLRLKLAARLDSEGNVRVVASDTRSQRQNRILAEERLVVLVRRALAVPKTRRKTAPSRSAIERRLTDKRMRSRRKQERRDSSSD